MYVFMYKIKSLSFIRATTVANECITPARLDHVKNDFLFFFRISVHEKKGQKEVKESGRRRNLLRGEKRKDDKEHPWKREMLAVENARRTSLYGGE